MRHLFARFARAVASALGTPYAFALAAASIVLWAALGPAFGFSETWQLVINTGTTIVTFLVVFLIQSTQNRDAKAVHLKLDELIHVISKARNQLIDCEELTDQELAQLEEEFRQLRSSPRRRRGKHAPDLRPELQQLKDQEASGSSRTPDRHLKAAR